jgi:hypothetical protein
VWRNKIKLKTTNERRKYILRASSIVLSIASGVFFGSTNTNTPFLGVLDWTIPSEEFARAVWT